MQKQQKEGARKILVIGGVAAGPSAASSAKRSNPDADVTIIQQESVVSYGSCGFPYLFEGLVENLEDLVVRTPQEFETKYGIKVLTNTKAEKINTQENKVSCYNVQTNKKTLLYYDSLVIATGARPAMPPIKGIDSENVFALRTFTDAVKLSNSTKNARSCVLVGAGLVGLEMAEAYRKQGLDVTIVEMVDSILPNLLSKKLSEIVSKHLTEHGVKLKLGHTVREIQSRGQKNTVVTDKENLDCDFVLLGVGVKPNTEIAKDAGLELGTNGAIRVNQYMETNKQDVYAAGDCATAFNYVTGKDSYLPLGTTSNKQGKIAGKNAAFGKREEYFRGIAGSAITKAFDLYIGKTGLSLKESQELGYDDAIENQIQSATRAGYYPGGKPIWINMVASKRSGKLLGAQIVGGEYIKGRIDQVALALLLNASIEDMANYDWCYVPPTSPVWDPLGISATQLQKKILKSTSFASPQIKSQAT